jgi:hypothetical protein
MLVTCLPQNLLIVTLRALLCHTVEPFPEPYLISSAADSTAWPHTVEPVGSSAKIAALAEW